MTRWIEIAAITAGSVAGAAAAALVVGALLWTRATARAVRRLHAGHATQPSRFSAEQLAGLPAPVVRYFEFALIPGQALVRHVRLNQVGTFAPSRDAWSRFTAVEHFAVWPPAFVWDARIRMAPLVTARVRDSYRGGESAMHVKLAALVPFIDERGTPEMAASALLRYLAEAPWLPTALLPSAGVAGRRWTTARRAPRSATPGRRCRWTCTSAREARSSASPPSGIGWWTAKRC